MSGAGVMPGTNYTAIPVTLNLSAPRLNRGFHNVLPTRYHQQLHYEPDSAKCFILRTQMHLQGNSTLPEIRCQASNVNRANYRISSAEDTNVEDALPNIRSQGASRKSSHYSISQLDTDLEVKTIREALQEASYKEEQSTMRSNVFNTTKPKENDHNYPLETSKQSLELSRNSSLADELTNDQSDELIDSSTSLTGMRVPKKKHKKKKAIRRKADGRKSRIFNHRLKSAKKVANFRYNNVASQNYRFSEVPSASDAVPLGLLGASVKPIKVFQREPRVQVTNHKIVQSAKVYNAHSSPRLQDRAKTHLFLSPTKASARTPIPTAVTPIVAGSQSPSESLTKHVQELTLGVPAQGPAVQSPRVSQELKRLTKIYLSEKQSGKIQELGLDLPCAPPATPAPEMYEKYEYIPSMGDIRSQRAVKVKLEILERQERKIQEKLLVAKLKKEKQEEKDRAKHKKRRQRKEIYALNKIMTELEHKNFKEFCKMKGIDPKI